MSLRTKHAFALAAALAVSSGFGPRFGLAQTPASPTDPNSAAPSAPKADPAPPAKPPSARDLREAEKSYVHGAKALDKQDFATAEKDFDTAVDLAPDNPQYLAAQQIARQHHVTELIHAAERARLTGHPDEADNDLRQAFEIEPHNPMLQQHLDEFTHDVEPAAELNEHESIAVGPPIELSPTPGRHSFHIRANATDMLRQVLTAYGLTPTFDTSVKSREVRLDVDDVDYNEAARISKLLSKTFFVPLDPRRVLVAEDNKENRTKYERLATETVYFPGLTPTEISEMSNVARNVFDAQQATVSPAHATLTVRAPVAKMSVLNSTLAEMLDGRSEIQLDLRLYSIAKTRMQNIGVQLPTQATVFNVPSQLNSVISGNQALVQQIISSGLASAGDFAAIAAILISSGAISGSILGQGFAVFGGGLTLTGITTGPGTANLALNSSDTRILDSMTMRVLDQEESTIRAGTRYPIITSSYSSLAGNSLAIPGLSSAGVSSGLSALGIGSSGFNQTGQIIPQVQYQDLGLTLKVKPYIQKNRDVALNLDLQIQSLAGSSINNIPVLDSQEFKAVTTLKLGESALVISNMSKQQSKAVNGIPGLSDLPGFQSTTNTQTENDMSELVILITPHIVREAHTQQAGQMFVLPVHP
jgi:general secretion pathway protein D